MQPLSKSYAQKIFSKHGLGKITAYIWIKRGMVNGAYEINGKYILRENFREPQKEKFEKEKYVYDLIKKKYSIPVPKIIILDSDKDIVNSSIMILEKISGHDIIDSWKELTACGKEEIAFRAGKMLGKIHSIKLQNFGDFKDNSLGAYCSWSEYVFSELNRLLKYHNRLKTLEERTINKIKKQFKANEKLFEFRDRPSLIHGDYNFENMRCEGCKIIGIFDAEYALAADNEYEFANMNSPLFRYPYPLNQIFFDGYGKRMNLSENFEKKMIFYKMLQNLGTLVATRRFWGNKKMENEYRLKVIRLLHGIDFQ